jgi:hypothetical protein
VIFADIFWRINKGNRKIKKSKETKVRRQKIKKSKDRKNKKVTRQKIKKSKTEK